MSAQVPNPDEFAKNERGFCRWACAEEKTPSYFQNYFSFGQNFNLKLTAKMIMYKKFRSTHFVENSKIQLLHNL